MTPLTPTYDCSLPICHLLLALPLHTVTYLSWELTDQLSPITATNKSLISHCVIHKTRLGLNICPLFQDFRRLHPPVTWRSLPEVSPSPPPSLHPPTTSLPDWSRLLLPASSSSCSLCSLPLNTDSPLFIQSRGRALFDGFFGNTRTLYNSNVSKVYIVECSQK